MADAARPLPGRPETVSEFVAWENAQEMKHEFRRGQIRMMTGGSLRNTRISTTIAAALNAKMGDGPCFAYAENVRVAIEEAEAGYYPDVVVDCGPYDPHALAAAAPTVVFEVLSPATRDRDMAEKVPDYRDCATMRQIILVEPDQKRLHVWTLAEDGRWRETFVTEAKPVLALPALGVELTLDEIYARA